VAGAAEIARLLTQGTAPLAGDQDNALHMGTIVTWDRLTGANSVSINGVILPNLDALQGGIGISYTAGDVVIVQRKQTKYYILGKVASPLGSAGSAVVAGRDSAQVNQGSTGGFFQDLTGGVTGPSAQVYIGSSRSAIVLWTAAVETNQSKVQISFDITGASSFAAGSLTGSTIFHGNTIFNQAGSMSIATSSTITGASVITSAYGLNKGLNTFTMKYRVDLNGTGTGALISQRIITVIPL
jgi:hypothetical protein